MDTTNYWQSVSNFPSTWLKGQSRRVLKPWYTGGREDQGCRRCFFSCLRKTFLLLSAVWQFRCDENIFGFKIWVDKVRNFKGLCHDWQVHFVCNANCSCYSLRKFRNTLWKKTLQVCVKQMYRPNIIWNVANNKNELWKPVRLTSFQKRQLQSFSIFFFFCLLVPPFVIVLLSIHSFNILSRYFCFTQFGGSFHCLNFETFPDTAPFSCTSCKVTVGTLRWEHTRRPA